MTPPTDALGRDAAAPPPVPAAPLWFYRALLALARREWAEAQSYRVAALLRGASAVMAVLALWFFARFVGAAPNRHLAAYGGDYLTFGLIGLLATEWQQVGLSSLSERVRWAQALGYLEAELATPAPAFIVIGVAPVYALLAGLLRAAAYVLGARLLLDVDLSRAHLGSLALVLPLLAIVFLGLGLLTAATTMLARRTNPLVMILGPLSLFGAGVLYPVSVLPESVRAAANLLPLTHALEALRRAIMLGASPGAMLETLAALAAFAALVAPAGLALFVFALRRARIDGSLTTG